MMRLQIEVEKDCVVMAFGSRGRDLPLSFEQAEVVAFAVREKAKACEEWVRAGGTRAVATERRGIAVRGSLKDRIVRLTFPEYTDRELIPFEGAVELAKAIEATLRQLAYKVILRGSGKRE